MPHLLLAILISLPLTASPAGSESLKSAPPVAPTGLSCEFLTNPSATVIYDPQPELAWVWGTEDHPTIQSAYQIQVHRLTEAADSPAELIWDSDRVEGNQSCNIEYAGQPLEPAGRYEWRVRTWDQGGGPSDWSAPQRFRMAADLDKGRTSLYPLQQLDAPADKLVQIGSDGYLADFSRDAFGYLVLRFPAIDGQRLLELHFGEKLLNGRIDRKPGGTIRHYRMDYVIGRGATEVTIRPPRDQRNTSGDAVRLPKAIGVIAPFRYVEILGAPGELQRENVVRRQVEYPFDDAAADFECSDKTLNAIWDLCKYSIRATTFCGVYVDGDRERIPYEADAYLNQLAHYGVDREYALARFSHEYLLAHPTWPTEWKSHSILMAWADYWYTGNKESLAQNYEILKQKKLLTAAERPDGLVDTSVNGYRDIVDWPEGERDGYEMRPVNTVVNAFHYVTLRRMARMATVIGRSEDAHDFAQRAEVLFRQFNQVLWNPDSESYVDGIGSQHSSLHANLFPLAFGLVPAERVPAVIEFLKSRRMACSVYAAQYLLEGLYRADEDQYALELLTSRDKRSWYNMLRSGSTITLEAWDQEFKPNLDWNHAWGAAPASLIPMYLVGVRPTEPGFGRFAVQPRPGDLKSFRARVPSIRGAIEVAYERSEKSYTIEVTVPGNTTANVGLPQIGRQQPRQFSYNGRIVDATVRGCHSWIGNIPPGKHVFEASLVPTVSQAASQPVSSLQ